jgi:serine O-acetyltransferase
MMLSARESDVRPPVGKGDPVAMATGSSSLAASRCAGEVRAQRVQAIIRLHKSSRWLLQRGWRRPSRIIERAIRLVYAARIPAEADIDPSVHFSHNALAVVITKKARIGPRCHIGMHVLLGSRWPLRGGPILEADVIVHAGAKIIGPVTVGAGSVIGANAVVLDDVPPRSLAVGVPAVIKKSGLRIEDYRIPLDREVEE